jgi:cytoskeletal protein RodZ
MTEHRWNPWKFTAIGLALVILTAVLVRLAVVNWAQSEAQPMLELPVAVSTSAPACQSTPQDAAKLASSPPGTSSAPPRATAVSRRPAMSSPEQRDRSTLAAQKPIGTGGRPVRSAMGDDAERPGRGGWNSALRHDGNAVSPHDDPRATRSLIESP